MKNFMLGAYYPGGRRATFKKTVERVVEQFDGKPHVFKKITPISGIDTPDAIGTFRNLFDGQRAAKALMAEGITNKLCNNHVAVDMRLDDATDPELKGPWLLTVNYDNNDLQYSRDDAIVDIIEDHDGEFNHSVTIEKLKAVPGSEETVFTEEGLREVKTLTYVKFQHISGAFPSFALAKQAAEKFQLCGIDVIGLEQADEVDMVVENLKDPPWPLTTIS